MQIVFSYLRAVLDLSQPNSMFVKITPIMKVDDSTLEVMFETTGVSVDSERYN